MASDDERLIPPSIRDERALGFAAALARLSDLDLSPILVYMVDQVPSDVLPFLAEQFSVMGYDGWLMCSTDDERRALIKRAIELHRYKGTRWAVREIIKIIGYTDVTFTEQPPKRYHDGTLSRDRTEWRGTPGEQWALIRVLVDLPDSKAISAVQADLIRGGINAYKRRSSWLQHFGFRVRVVDELTPGEELTVKMGVSVEETVLDEPLAATIRYRSLHNGLRTYNGATYHGATFVEAL